jgi:putative FmdB family regulatory protein
MPTYQYRCTECGHDLEAVQRFSDAALTECPNCGGQLRKVYNAVGVVFKGSGFYRTDSREKPKSETAKGDGKGDKSDSTAKGDAKPAKSDGASGGTPGTSAGSSSVNGSSGSATSKTPSTAGSAA